MDTCDVDVAKLSVYTVKIKGVENKRLALLQTQKMSRCLPLIKINLPLHSQIERNGLYIEAREVTKIISNKFWKE